MEAYKFRTKVEEDGVIRIPEIARLAHQDVEVFVVVASDVGPQTDRTHGIQDFLDHWQGFLKGYDADELKAQYLREKYEADE
jgi:hypothetical protein